MSNDLDSLRTLVTRAMGTGWEAAYRQDVAALVAEVERLRGEVSLLQQEACIRRNISDGLAAEVAAERAAVVAWLRDEVDDDDNAEGSLACILAYAANAIESGEHRREEE